MQRGQQQVAGHGEPGRALGRQRLQQPGRAAVGPQQVPAGIDHDRAERFLLRQHRIDRAPQLAQLGRGQRGGAKHRGVAGRGQQRVVLAQRDLERAGQREHQVAARRGAAGLDEGQVPRRDPGPRGQRLLAHAARLPPRPQRCSEGVGHARPYPGGAARSLPAR
jgi:hypothetical protein